MSHGNALHVLIKPDLFDLDVFHVWVIMIGRVFQFQDQEGKANVCHLFDRFQSVKVQNENHENK